MAGGLRWDQRTLKYSARRRRIFDERQQSGHSEEFVRTDGFFALHIAQLFRPRAISNGRILLCCQEALTFSLREEAIPRGLIAIVSFN